MAEDSRSTEDGEYAKEVIAQASNSSANMMGNISAIPYGVRKEETIYYTASKIYKHGEFKGVQIDQYTDLVTDAGKTLDNLSVAGTGYHRSS